MTNPLSRVQPVDEASLVCKIGDRLVVHEASLTQEGEKVEVGSIYEVADRAQYAWILRLVHGPGAPHLRILNSALLAILTPTTTASVSFGDANPDG